MNTSPPEERAEAHAQEGEFFTDEAQKPIPSRDTWGELSFQQLTDLQIQLEDKAWTFSKNPVISKTLGQALEELRALIASRF